MSKEYPFAKVRRANLTNILKKAAKGNTLSAADLKIIKDAESSAGDKRETRTQKEKAKEYYVSRMTITRWEKEGAPFDDDREMNAWVIAKQRQPKKFHLWQKEKGFSDQPEEPDDIDEDFSSQEEVCIYYRKKLSSAARSGNTAQVKLWNELLLKTDESIRRSEMHSAKLGLDNGTTLPRAEVERILRAVFYAGNACVQGSLTSVSEHLTAIENPADLYHALKPIIVGGRLFAGFDKVKNTAGAPGLPAWVVDCVKLEAQQYLDSSESLWTKGKRHHE